MRVALVRRAVRGPARVRDADRSRGSGCAFTTFSSIEILPFASPRLEAVAVAHRDAGRVVAAILEALEPLDQ